MKHIVTTLALLFLAYSVFSQDDKKKAYELGMEGIRLVDEEGNYDKAIALFKKAAKLDPDNINYPYEIAFAYMGKKEYSKAIKAGEALFKRSDVTDQTYQLVGNAYDLNGDPDKAIETYDLGLKRFPNSGKLYVEKGNVYMINKKYNEAITAYEEGIYKDPTFPSNYYRAANLYLNSSEEIWGMIYGEMFINMESNTQRTADMSRKLYETYKSEIKFTEKGDSAASVEVSFCQNNVITLDNLSEGKLTLPFPMGCYEMNLSIATALEKKIDLASLNRIRSTFIDLYFKNGQEKDYPNILFDYQNQLKEAGHLEAYNYWILMRGNEAEFEAWFKVNEEKFKAFAEWFNENQLEVTEEHRFYRSQY